MKFVISKQLLFSGMKRFWKQPNLCVGFMWGDVIVANERNGSRVSVGIVIDRDIVAEIMSTELDPKVITVGEIMMPEFFTAKKSMGFFDAIQFMHSRSNRRLSVTNEAEEMLNLTKLLRYQQKNEIK